MSKYVDECGKMLGDIEAAEGCRRAWKDMEGQEMTVEMLKDVDGEG